jgi:hypothetical protein
MVGLYNPKCKIMCRNYEPLGCIEVESGLQWFLLT